MAGRNAMDLVLTQPGVVGTNFNGARNDMLNISLDHANILDNFITESLSTTQIFTSVDRIEEVRVVTSPADAEFGRGSGQVQLISKSGTNQFHGTGFDNIHNTILNANTWSNNRSGLPRSSIVQQRCRWFAGRSPAQEQDVLLRTFRGQHRALQEHRHLHYADPSRAAGNLPLLPRRAGWQCQRQQSDGGSEWQSRVAAGRHWPAAIGQPVRTGPQPAGGRLHAGSWRRTWRCCRCRTTIWPRAIPLATD